MNKTFALTLILSVFCIFGKGYTAPPCCEIVEVPIVDGECYEQLSASYQQLSVAYQRLACDCRNTCGTLLIGGDYLYWHADNDILNYAIDGVGTNRQGKVYALDPEWSSGYRAFVGYCFPCENWFLNLCWTHYQTNTSETTRPAPGLSLYSVRGNPAGSFSIITNRAIADWDLDLDILKLDLSCRFWASFNLSFMPSIGVRWDQINDKFDITYILTTTPTTEFINIHQDINAIGPTIGLGSEWNFYHNLSLFGDFQWAFLWSRYKIHQIVDVVQTAVTSDINTRQKKQISKQNLDLLVGLMWRSHFTSSSGIIVKVGWENLIWLDYGESFYFTDTVADGRIIPATNDLTLSGLTVRAEVFF